MAKRSVNRVELIGNLVRDAETKFTPSGASVTNFTVATSYRFKKGDEWVEESEFTKVTAWRIENLANYLTKGKQIRVDGRLKTRSYDDKDGKKIYVTDVVADDIMLLGGQQKESPAPANYGKSGEHHLSDNRMGITDDDVPF